MERLTDKHEAILIKEITENKPHNEAVIEALRKLAAYEDTGLSPDEVMALKAERDAAVSENKPDKRINFSKLNYSELCAFLEKHPQYKI